MTNEASTQERNTNLPTHAKGYDPIKNIHVVQTGWAEQHKEHRYGTRVPQMWWVLSSRSWVPLPINAFLIEHSDGFTLFDTGLDPAISSDPNYISSAVGRFLLHRIFRLHIRKEDALRYQLEALDVSAKDIRRAVISHLHFDHVGGIADIPNAELIVSEREWAQLSMPHPERVWILSEHIKLPRANWRPIEFSPSDDPLFSRFGGTFDVMGDGSMILLPTPGHTLGSLSMLVNSNRMPPILLVGDLTYQTDLLLADKTPGTGDAKQLRETYAKVRALKADLPNLIILASHDSSAKGVLIRAKEAL